MATYKVTHSGDTERHVIKLKRTELQSAAPYVNRELYKKLASTNNLADAIAALALVVKAIEAASAANNKTLILPNDPKPNEQSNPS